MTSGNGYKDRLDEERAARETSEALVESYAAVRLAEVADREWTCGDEIDEWVAEVVTETTRAYGLDDPQQDYLRECLTGSGQLPDIA